MRYENWDVLLFPRESKIPVKEFSASCHVVRDDELGHAQGMHGIPTMCCFIPSLGVGSRFQISIHAWTPPDVSQFTKSYSVHHEFTKIETRVFVDGLLVASSVLPRIGSWPHVIANTQKLAPTGAFDPLRFPTFRQELLQQTYWNAGDSLGRITVALAEVFEKDSPSMPVERVKNVVAFSFQHAPLDILESSGIAWPRPSMWNHSPAICSSMPGPSFVHPETRPHSSRRGTTASQEISMMDPFATYPPASYPGDMSADDAFAPHPFPVVNDSDPSLYGLPAVFAENDSLWDPMSPPATIPPSTLTQALLSHAPPHVSDGTQGAQMYTGLSPKPEPRRTLQENKRLSDTPQSMPKFVTIASPSQLGFGADITNLVHTGPDGEVDKGKRSGSSATEDMDETTPTMSSML